MSNVGVSVASRIVGFVGGIDAAVDGWWWFDADVLYPDSAHS